FHWSLHQCLKFLRAEGSSGYCALAALPQPLCLYSLALNGNAVPANRPAMMETNAMLFHMKPVLLGSFPNWLGAALPVTRLRERLALVEGGRGHLSKCHRGGRGTARGLPALLIASLPSWGSGRETLGSSIADHRQCGCQPGLWRSRLNSTLNAGRLRQGGSCVE